ncbi:MAG: hypothetical protein JWM76_1314 [Pseudonocardiales bacterium]|nr:hypothetical protein [Pseudonocardiales bacterium]
MSPAPVIGSAVRGPGTVAVGTIIAVNYVAQARVLQESFAQHHPGLPFFTLVIDGDESHRRVEGLGQVVLPEDLALTPDHWYGMAAQYTVMELATAAKPALLRYLLQGARSAVYFDPDIVIYAPMHDVFAAAARHSIALTPHCLHPVPRDGLGLSESQLMHAGIFNLGFIGVGPGSRPFLRWWQERLFHDSIVDFPSALFTDQRWIDWVPSLFEHTVLRDPGLNVAYWNVHERNVRTTSSGEVRTGSCDLRFFHFSGYDPSTPWLLSKHAAPRPRAPLEDSEPVQDLCADYAARLHAAGYSDFHARPYRLNRLDNGFVMTDPIRRFVRSVMVAPEALGVVPNPYLETADFMRWLTEPVSGTVRNPIRRWEHVIWLGRMDLKSMFPDLGGAHAAPYRNWLRSDPWAMKEGLSYETTEPVGDPDPVSTPARRRASPGWSVVAYADAELGVGEAGRRLSKAVLQIGLPTEVVGVGGVMSREHHRHLHDVRRTPSFDNAVICVNADQLERVGHAVGLPASVERRGARVGLWFWEADRIPDTWRSSFALLDQVWVASEYTRVVLDRIGLCPVHLIRLPVFPRSAPTTYRRSMVGLPEDSFTFLCTYDFFSIVRRKNPVDVIRAYISAFGPRDGAALVLKSINGHLREEELAIVRREAARRPDIHIIDGYRRAGEMAAMIELADCVVSLHRSEGYGLNLVDAMTVGTPVIATGYSGNMTFMDADSAFLVPYEEVEVGEGAYPYPVEARWAQPDVEAASAIMRSVFDDQGAARQRGRAGQRTVLAANSLEVAGARVRELTSGLMAERGSA